jgi:hypothetical protein
VALQAQILLAVLLMVQMAKALSAGLFSVYLPSSFFA